MSIVDSAQSVVGGGSARAGTPEDAVGGIVPRVVVEPGTAEAVAATLAWATKDKLTVVPRGAGTKLEWGPAPRTMDVLLSTARLNKVLAHRHGDLTATVQAGAALIDVNRELGQHKQWIPMDPPAADRATIGGLVATNDSGPRRHRYGAPRDLIIGVDLARADGQLAKGGGIVVKNVAGYDLGRLLTGSFGSLAVIVGATFKLYPLTAASRTLIVDAPNPSDLCTVVLKLLGCQLTPTAIELETPPLRMLLRFESIPASVEQQAATATKLIEATGLRVKVVDGADEERLWAQHAKLPWEGPGAVVKIALLPSELGTVLSTLQRLGESSGYAVAGRAGVGVMLARVDGTTEAQSKIISELRDLFPMGRGSVVLVRGSRELKNMIDVWGPIGDGLPLMREVKQRFDPAGILNPGRGPGGI